MRRTSGLWVGTIAVLAVLLIGLSVGAGAFAFPSAVGVRTTGPAHTEAVRTAAPVVAAHASAPAVVRPTAPAHFPAAPPTNNTTLTSVAITPVNTTIAGGVHQALTATIRCTYNATVETCPTNLTSNVTYAWSVANSYAGALNVTNLSAVTFIAGWNPATTEISVVASITNLTEYANGSATGNANITVGGDGTPTVSVQYSTAFKTYMPIPWNLNFNVSITGGPVSKSDTWISINVRDLIPTCAPFSIVGAAPCPSVTNVSVPVAAGQSSYSLQVNYTMMDSQGYANPTAGVFPADAYQFIAWVTENNSVANVTGSLAQNVYVVFQVPSGVFNNPVPGTSLSTGNLTFAMTYNGEFITAAELSVKNATGQVVFLAAVFAVGVGNRTVVVPTAWLAVTPGAYKASVNVTTPYGNYFINQSYTVIPAGQTIYINETSYHNATLLGGLSNGIAGMLLIVIGLIIGLVVALVLGRMMWGTPSQPSSPQPWSPTSSGGSSGGSGGSSGTGGSSTPPSTGSSDMGSEGSTTDK